MKLVAVVRASDRPEQAVQALAEGTGLTLAEARMRLAPEPPVLVARLERDQGDALVASLRASGLAALAVDDSCPTDRDAVLVHRFALADAGGTFTPRSGQSVEVAWTQVAAILRGLRASRTDVQRTEKSKSFSIGRAVLTGGLVASRTSTTSTRSSSESTEQLVLLYLRDGRALRLAEQELEFSCLGPAMRPSSTGNMVELAGRLRARAGGAFYDERLLRLGRRPLPFVIDGGSRTTTAQIVTTRSDTSSTLDVLAEVMWRALLEGLLP